MSLLLLAQVDIAAQQAAAEPAGELTLSFWELTLKGGWIMIPLALLWFIAVYLFIERFWAIKKASKEDTNFMNRIKEYIYEDKVESALALCQAQNTPVARMIEKGIQRIGKPLSDVNAAIENVGNLEISKLEGSLPTLATIAGGAPMIGFLGTVIG
ncbi:MAG TPA: MotA/TolQ/ExbB proton channel family protein, partial [Tenuifilaceae bacterium]|nr:MotA/TolQ/ExbB proton channel family protein [Tenuifilaceae bacterium]